MINDELHINESKLFYLDNTKSNKIQIYIIRKEYKTYNVKNKQTNKKHISLWIQTKSMAMYIPPVESDTDIGLIVDVYFRFNQQKSN